MECTVVTFMPAIPGGGERVLLHCCCAPCSGAILESLCAAGIAPVIFFSNSNIVPLPEYEKRRAEVVRYAEKFGFEVVEGEYDHEEWLEAVKGLEAESERGRRCLECFRFRLIRAARYAASHGIPVVATTLAASRWKELSQVDEAGRAACRQVSEESGFELVWWGQNWRKQGLQQRRSEIIREQDFYNQTYCGCEFSEKH